MKTHFAMTMKKKFFYTIWLLAAAAFLLGLEQTDPSVMGKGNSVQESEGFHGLGEAALTPCREQIDITSDQMVADYKNASVTFRGHVKAVQCDLVLTADEITARYGEDGASISRITASGHVQVAQGERMARGEQAVFQGDERTITLVGNPVLAQGKSEIRGDKIIVFIDEGRMDIEGGVNAVLYPGSEGN